MKTEFSEFLAKARKAAGFSTAYRFYHDNGGRPVLTFTYRKYLHFEQGKFLPEPEALRRISLALKLIPQSAPAGELVLVWLRTMAGEETYAAVFEPYVSVRSDIPGLSPVHKALGRFVKKQPITVSQARLVLSSAAYYRAFLVLLTVSETWSVDKFSAAAGLAKGVAGKVLSDFARAGLLRKLRNGAYSPAAPEVILEFPRAEILPGGLNDRMRGYQAELAAAGVLTWRRMTMVRADAVELASFYPVLSLGLSTAAAYETMEKTDRTALFAIESRVVKLFDI